MGFGVGWGKVVDAPVAAPTLLALASCLSRVAGVSAGLAAMGGGGGGGGGVKG